MSIVCLFLIIVIAFKDQLSEFKIISLGIYFSQV